MGYNLARAKVATSLSTEERIKRQLARELHDQVAQTLTTMLIEMEQFKDEQVGRQSVIREVETLQANTRDVLQNIRQLLYDLRGEPGIDDDFPETVRMGLLRGFEERSGIGVMLTVSPSWPSAISAQASLNLYRILQEALNNVRLHSGAHNAQVVLSRDGDRVNVSVTDDGNGLTASTGSVGGLGLLGMRERVVLLGGDLAIDSDPALGTTVSATFPVDQLL